MVIVQVLSQSQLQNGHVVPDFDYFWTKSHMRLELGFYIMSLLSNILQMLSPEGVSTFQGAQILLKQSCFSMFWCMIRTWAALSTAHRCAGVACSPQPEHHPWESSPITSLGPPLPLPPCKAWAINTKFYTGIPRMQTAPPNCLHMMCLTANRPEGLWPSLCNPTTEANASNLGTFQMLSPAILHHPNHAPEVEP